MSSQELILDRQCQECRFEREDEFYRIIFFKKKYSSTYRSHVPILWQNVHVLGRPGKIKSGLNSNEFDC